MQQRTAAPAPPGTGSTTIADLMELAAAAFGDQPAVKYKREGRWLSLSYREVGEIVSEIGRGLIDLGLAPGDRVALLCTTRPEWTFVDFAITSVGGVVVPIYPTNSPPECQWVAANSESRFIVCEDASQVAKILAVRDELPALEAIVAVEPADGAIPLADLRARGRERDREELTTRARAVRPQDPYTFIYTSGTTGPPKGCVLSHSNFRSVVSMCEEVDVIEPGSVTYLFLPLAHAYALLIQLMTFDRGSCLAYWGGDTTRIVPELMETKPRYLPSVPRIFEKIYTLVTSGNDPAKIAAATQVGLKVRALQAAGEPIPPDLQGAYDKADAELFAKVRGIFGGNLKQAHSGAAPIAREILEFFYACGAPVLEGYGMTETSTVATTSTTEDFRFGTVGRAIPGCEVRIAASESGDEGEARGSGEILVKGPNVFQGYYKMRNESFGAIVDGWLHTGDLGALDADGYLTITGRKKDIIITAGGKNITPANLENDLKQSRWISQAVMYGDRRPYPVALITLDPEEIVHFARERGLPEDPAALAREPQVRELVQGIVDDVNVRYARVEQIKRFFILDHDLSQQTGELTPTLKVKRNVVIVKYAADFERLYAED